MTTNVYEKLLHKWGEIETRRLEHVDSRTWSNWCWWEYGVRDLCGKGTTIEWDIDGSCIVAGTMLFLPKITLDSKVL
jgi:hypothetical protein